MALSSPNRIVWTYFRSLRKLVDRIPEIEDDVEQKDAIVVAILLSVAAVEAFINVYFRVLVEEPSYTSARATVLNDLTPQSGKPKGLEYKLKHWPPKVFGRSFCWQSGVALEFDQIRRHRNNLMHFVSSHTTFSIPGIQIHGLADTECFDSLEQEHALRALSVAEGMVKETLRLRGLSTDEIAKDLPAWLGIPPVL